MIYFELVISQIIIFIIYAAVGVIAVKTGLLQEKSLDVISKLVIKISLPIMIFHNTLTGATVEQFKSTASIMLWTAVMYFAAFFVAYMMKKMFKLKGDKGRVFHACSMFGNVGFMGIPVVITFFPENGMLYIAMFTVIDQIVLWTAGVLLTTPEREAAGLDKMAVIRMAIKKMINPATVGITLAIIGIFIGVKLPAELDTALSKIGGITSPLAMIYLGALFCYTDVLGSFKKLELYATIIIKMVIFPIAFYVIMGLVPGINPDIQMAMTILSAMPTMTTISMLAKSQGSAGEYGASAIFLTTLFSVVTLPLVCYVTAMI